MLIFRPATTACAGQRTSRARGLCCSSGSGLTSKAQLEYTKLSGGHEAPALAGARARSTSRKLLILDEPTAGVDVELRLELWEWLRRAQRGRPDDLSHDALFGGSRGTLPHDRDRPRRASIVRREADQRAARRRRDAAGRLPGADARRSTVNVVALWTLVKREMIRSLKIINQVIWPPIITTLLYVFVFGLALGSRIPSDPGRHVRAVPHPRADHAAGDRFVVRRVLEFALPRPLHELDSRAAHRADVGLRDRRRVRCWEALRGRC